MPLRDSLGRFTAGGGGGGGGGVKFDVLAGVLRLDASRLVNATNVARAALGGLSKAGEGLHTITDSLRRSAEAAMHFAEKIKTVGAGMAAAATAAAVAGAKIGAGYEQSMARVRAITGATQDEFEALGKEAQRLGVVTVHSARDAANGFAELAQGGYKATQIIKAMPQVFNLVDVAQVDTATATRVLVNVMEGFGQTVEDLPKDVNILSKALTIGGNNIQEFADAFSYVGPVAKAAGVPLEDLAATIQILGKSGFHGSMAGTGIRGIISYLALEGKNVEKTFKAVGVELKDSTHKLRPLTEIIDDFNAATKRLGTENENVQQIMQAIGLRAGPQFLALMEKGGPAIRAASAEIGKASGQDFAAGVAEAMRDTFQSRLTMVMGTLSGFGVTINKVTSGPLKALLFRFNDWIAANKSVIDGAIKRGWDLISLAITKAVSAGGRLWKEFGPVLDGIWQRLQRLWQTGMAWYNSLTPAQQDILKVTVALTAFGTALSTIGGSIPMIGQFITGFGDMVNPIKLVGGAIDSVLPLFGVGEGLLGVLGSLIGVSASVGGMTGLPGGGIIGGVIGAVITAIVGGKGLAWALDSDNLHSAVQGAGDLLQNGFKGAIDIAQNALETFKGILTGDWNKISAGINGMLADVAGAAAKLADALGLHGIAAALRDLAGAAEGRSGYAHALSEAEQEVHTTYGSHRAVELFRGAKAASARREKAEAAFNDIGSATWALNHIGAIFTSDPGSEREKAKIKRELELARVAEQKAQTAWANFQQSDSAQIQAKRKEEEGAELVKKRERDAEAQRKAEAAKAAKESAAKAEAESIKRDIATAKSAQPDARIKAEEEQRRRAIDARNAAKAARSEAREAQHERIDEGLQRSNDEREMREYRHRRAAAIRAGVPLSDLGRVVGPIPAAAGRIRDRLKAKVQARIKAEDEQHRREIDASNSTKAAQESKQKELEEYQQQSDDAQEMREYRRKRTAAIRAGVPLADIGKVVGPIPDAAARIRDRLKAKAGGGGVQLGKDIAKGMEEEQIQNPSKAAQAKQDIAQAMPELPVRPGLSGIRDIRQAGTSASRSMREAARKGGTSTAEQGDMSFVTSLFRQAELIARQAMTATDEEQKKLLEQSKKLLASAKDAQKAFEGGKRGIEALGKAARLSAEDMQKLDEEEKAKAAGKLAPWQQQAADAAKQAQQQMQQQIQQQMQQAVQQGVQQAPQAAAAAGAAPWAAQGQGMSDIASAIATASQAGDPVSAYRLFSTLIGAKLGAAKANLHLLSQQGPFGTGAFGPDSDNYGYLMSLNTPGVITIKQLQAAFDAIQRKLDSLIKGKRHFAAGGVVTRPTDAYLGETGPEAVIPLWQLANNFRNRVTGHLGIFGGGRLPDLGQGGLIQGMAGAMQYLLQNYRGASATGRFGAMGNALLYGDGGNSLLGGAFSVPNIAKMLSGDNSALMQMFNWSGGRAGWNGLNSLAGLNESIGSAIDKFRNSRQMYLGPAGAPALASPSQIGGLLWGLGAGSSNLGPTGGTGMGGHTFNTTLNVHGADLTTEAQRQQVAESLFDHFDRAAGRRGLDTSGRSALRSPTYGGFGNSLFGVRPRSAQ